MVIGLTSRQWSSLLKVTGTGAVMDQLAARSGVNLKDEGGRWQMRHHITEILKPWFAARTSDEVSVAFDGVGVTWSKFQTIKEAVAEDSDLSVDNPMFDMLHQPGLGTFPVPSSPASFSSFARKPAAKAPVLGAHTEEIQGDVVRMDDAEISALFDDGIVQSPNYSASRKVA